MSLLTKTKYLNGLQCSKLLWVSEHDKARVPEPDISTDYNFEQGIMVGNLAKQLYPGGIDLASFPFGENLEKTQELLDERLPLFEAGFKVKFDGREIFSKIDILLPVEDDQWDIIEVKSSTKVKAPNIEDVSFQKFCLERAGLKIRKCHLMHINNQYVRNKEIEVDRLLVAVEVTDEVEEYIGNVEQESISIEDIEEQADIRIFTLTGTGDVKIQMEGNLGFIGGIVDSPEKPYYIPKTTDGGKTWENSELPDNVTPYWINDFCFIDNEIIFAIGTQNYNEGAFILYSNNQGKSWEWISPTNIAGLFSISMADKDYGYLIGSKQGVLGKVFVGKTEDSGNTLKKVEFFDDKKDMLDVFVLDKNHAWIVGKGNKIYRLYN